jgi:hypothetical protein
MSTNGTNGGVVENLKGIEIEDVVEVSVVALFFVQKLGKASAGNISDGIQKIHGEVNPNTLEQALEGLRARGLLSYARGKSKAGESVQMYKTTKVKWAQPPEVAHISDLLPALVATEEAKKIISILNDAESEGDGDSKSKRKLGYEDYYEIRVDFITMNPLMGSTPPSPYLDTIVKKSPYPYPEKADLRFWRDSETGAVVIPSDVVGAWVRTGLRFGFGLADSAAHYISASEIHIMPKEIVQASLPIIDQTTRKGLGIQTFECLPKGIEFSAHFRVPSRGISEPEKFVAWMMSYAPRPVRGLSPARGRRFGRLEVVGYKIFGQSEKIENALGSVVDAFEDPRAKKLAIEMMARAKQYDMSFKPKKGGEVPASTDSADTAA